MRFHYKIIVSYNVHIKGFKNSKHRSDVMTTKTLIQYTKDVSRRWAGTKVQ